MWCVPEIDDEYLSRMENVLRVYRRPTNAHRPVVCIDEKPTQLTGDSRPGIPLKPGKIAKIDYEYVRNGKANIFVAVEPKRGRHLLKVTDTRKGIDFAHFLKDISKKYRYAKKINIILDNLNTHCEKSLIDAFGERRGKKLWARFDVHYTPKHASWLNQAECEIGLFSREALSGFRVASKNDLIRKVQCWEREANQRRRTIRWKFTVSKARKKFKLSEH